MTPTGSRNLISFVILSVSGISILFGSTSWDEITSVRAVLIKFETIGSSATAPTPSSWKRDRLGWNKKNRMKNFFIIKNYSKLTSNSIWGACRKVIETQPTIGISARRGSKVIRMRPKTSRSLSSNGMFIAYKKDSFKLKLLSKKTLIFIKISEAHANWTSMWTTLRSSPSLFWYAFCEF